MSSLRAYVSSIITIDIIHPILRLLDIYVSALPADEQNFLVNTINRLQSLPEWNSTAIIITYDDSGGWYDHVLPPIVSQSNDPANDGLLGNVGLCGHAPAGSYQDRCGYGPRLPLLIISPYASSFLFLSVDGRPLQIIPGYMRVPEDAIV